MRQFAFPIIIFLLTSAAYAQTDDVKGRVFWRGDVDDRVHLVIRNESLEMRIISGETRPDGNYSFTAALPGESVSVEVNKKEGRGDVKVIQQPTAENAFTAIVEIYDKRAGSKVYQLEILWR